MKLAVIPLEKHCYNFYRRLIAEFDMMELDYNGAVVLGWLRLAYAITRIDVDTMKYESCFCQEVFDYEGAVSEMLEECGTEITRFIYIWNVYEAFIKFLDISKRGDTDQVIAFINKNYENEFPLPFYYHEIQDKLLQKYPKDIINKNVDWGLGGYALHIIRKRRNQIVHGDLKLPEPSMEQGEKLNRFNHIPELFSRVMLTVMQMMTIAYLGGKYNCKLQAFKPEYLSYDKLDINVFRILHVTEVC